MSFAEKYYLEGNTFFVTYDEGRIKLGGYPAVVYRNDCNFCDVSAGDFRFHAAFDFWSLHSGITAVKGVLSLQLSYLPCLVFLGCGVLVGAVTVVKGIKVCLERFRVQTIYAILGMMIGSFYAIVMGPTTLETPQSMLQSGSFHVIACLVGVVLVLGMQWAKEKLDG